MIYPNQYHQDLSRSELQDVAFSIGVKLCKEAIWDNDKCNWIGPGLSSINGELCLTEKACSIDFYHGTSGISTFLSLLFRISKDPIVEETLEGCFQQILSGFKTIELSSNLSCFEGYLGVAISLIKNGELLERKDLIAEGLAMIENIANKKNTEESLDLMGIAGAVSSLLRIHKNYNQPWILPWTISLGHHIINLAQKTDQYWSWKTVNPEIALPGYAHGSSGIALALLNLYIDTGEDHFLHAASMGFNHCQHLLSLKPNTQGQGLASSPQSINNDSWCYGSPGIAIPFLKAWEHTDNEDYKKIAEYAVELTYNALNYILQQPYPHNYSLCHGLAGNADVLLYASQKLKVEKYKTLAHVVAKMGYLSYFRTGLEWPGGLNDPKGITGQNLSVPGFMLGISGTGYFYLRLSQPEKVACNLLIV